MNILNCYYNFMRGVSGIWYKVTDSEHVIRGIGLQKTGQGAEQFAESH